jgi:NO-binding membrane sensor protein with MHYT domain
VITISPIFIIPIFIAAATLSAWQHVRIARMNPFAGIQLWLMLFCIVMMLAVNFLDRRSPDPWLTVLFFVIAVTTFLFALRQNRMVPPRQTSR